MRGGGPGSAEGDRAWILLSLAAPPPAEALLLVDALRRLGARSVEREGGRVVALFPPHDDPASLAADARLAARASTRIDDPDIAWRRLGPAEWAERWGSGHPPRRVSDRIVVVTRAEPGAVESGGGRRPDGAAGVDARPGDRLIRLEPSTAFGSAEHPTTRACLRMLDRLVEPGDRVLDVGAGSGVLAIAAALLGADRALALEADAASCAAARRNAALNAVSDRVRVEEVDVVPGSLRSRGRFDGVLANLRAAVLGPLMGDLAGAVGRGGWLVASGVVRSEWDDVLEAAAAAGLRLRAEDLEEGWWTGRLSR